MPNLALYRKYRPATFAEVIGQAHVKTTLQNALKTKKIGHSYLFAGPRGTGKTTIARLVAKAANCQKLAADGEPCGQCANCRQIKEQKAIDIIEIDAASNRGIDEIRELRDKVKFPPTNFPYKVFIIDEVHMLTKEAFNALLKTLEEPPSHAIFMLATTEPRKIPATIISRCQRFSFHKLTSADLTKYLQIIAKAEKINITAEALSVIVAQSEGFCRDAVSLLDQIAAIEGGKIELQQVREILGLADQERIYQLLEHLGRHQAAASLDIIQNLSQDGQDLDHFTQNLLESLRRLLLLKINPKAADYPDLFLSQEEETKLKKIAELFSPRDLSRLIKTINQNQFDFHASPIPELALEISLAGFLSPYLESCPLPPKPASNASENDPPTPRQKFTPVEPLSQRLKKDSPAEPVPAITANNDPAQKPAKPIKLNLDKINRQWSKIIVQVKSRNTSLATLLNSAYPVQIQNNQLIIASEFCFHRDRLDEIKNKRLIEEVLAEIFDGQIILVCQTINDLNPDQVQKIKETKNKYRSSEKKEDETVVKEAEQLFAA